MSLSMTLYKNTKLPNHTSRTLTAVAALAVPDSVIEKFDLTDPVIVVKNSDNKYDYELYENGVEIASGTTKVDMKKKSSKILFSYYDNEEELGMEITIEISVKTNGEVEKKDVTNSISSERSRSSMSTSVCPTSKRSSAAR